MNIIFHYPLPLNPNATSASGIRPLKMLDAFKSLGYHVDIIVGYSKERKRAINNIKDKIKSGVKYDFLYSESSTMPTILTDPSHIPLHPNLDFSFFKFCKVHNIPIGLFYRDIYWAFEGNDKHLNPIKRILAKLCYKYDLLNYNKYLTKLYLPSYEMGKYIPFVSKNIFATLPPAHDVNNIEYQERAISDPLNHLNIFYVGGISDHYQMHKLFNVVKKREDIKLTVCTRSSEWLSVKSEYPDLSNLDNIEVIHENGESMREFMINSDITSIFVKPQEYREFAVPVKLFEYLGYRKPIIASQGTLAGTFVAENNIGWTIPYDEYSLNQLFDSLIHDPKKYAIKREHMASVSSKHTWQARAKQVIQELT